MSASGIIEHLWAHVTRSAYVMLHHYMGDIDGALEHGGSREDWWFYGYC